MKNKTLLSKMSLSFVLFASTFAVTTLVIFTVPYAREISAIRQFDLFIGIPLAVVCGILLAIMIALSIKKKTKGTYMTYGMIIAALNLYLYSIVDAKRMFQLLYIPAIQNIAVKSGIHVDVTTIQSAQNFANILNMVLCAGSTVLLAAVLVSAGRYIASNFSNSLRNTGIIFGVLGILAGSILSFVISNYFGYAVMYMVVALGLAIFAFLAQTMLRLLKKSDKK